LETAKRIIDDLPFPAFAITRDYNFHYWNGFGLKLFNASEEFAAEELKRPKKDLNILRYIFDPSTQVYNVFNNYGRSSRWLEYTWKLNVWRFKQDNILCQYDEWYQDRIKSLMMLPNFTRIWEKIHPDTGIEEIQKDMPLGMLAPEFVTHIYTRDGREFRIRGLQIDYTGWDYPRIMVYMYDDEYARGIFEELGIPTSNNGWTPSWEQTKNIVGGGKIF
jgi:hypothetical protein